MVATTTHATSVVACVPAKRLSVASEPAGPGASTRCVVGLSLAMSATTRFPAHGFDDIKVLFACLHAQHLQAEGLAAARRDVAAARHATDDDRCAPRSSPSTPPGERG